MTTLEENIKVTVTIFYSNYSGNCKALLQRINNSNLMDKLSLKFINVDNDIMKSIITRKFSVVPAIVVMIEDEISLYTGDNVFEWFNIFSSSHQANEVKQPLTLSPAVGDHIPKRYGSSDHKSLGNLPGKELTETMSEKNPHIKFNHDFENQSVVKITTQQGNPTEPTSYSKSKSILDIAAEISKAREKI